MVDTMRAVILKSHGPAEGLVLGTSPLPEVGPEQVLIKVRAASVNRPDIMQREGNYPPPPGESDILGLEVAGTVATVGKEVTNWRVGDRVMALIGGGGYAEYALAHAGHVMGIPDILDFHQAACICETYITAYLNLFMLGGFSEGQFALVHGGGGGVTTAAIQLSQVLIDEPRLIVTASTGKVERVRAQGVLHVVDYQTTDFVDAVHEITDARGVDLILDHIGAEYLSRNMRALAVSGKMVLIGVMGGVKAELHLAQMLIKRQQILGSVLRPRPIAEKASIISTFAAAVLPHFAQGSIVPLIHSVFSLGEAAEAHRLMESSGHFGKIVLDMD